MDIHSLNISMVGAELICSWDPFAKATPFDRQMEMVFYSYTVPHAYVGICDKEEARVWGRVLSWNYREEDKKACVPLFENKEAANGWAPGSDRPKSDELKLGLQGPDSKAEFSTKLLHAFKKLFSLHFLPSVLSH